MIDIIKDTGKKQGFLQPTPAERLAALDAQLADFKAGRLAPPEKTDFVNNHIHTIYSFSPYSPTGAAYTAWAFGLSTAGIMDHDSAAGAQEFLQAAEKIGIAPTCGFECRVKMDDTPFAGRRTNNPDQVSVSYMACHGIPHQNLEKAQQWLVPVRAARGRRNAAMVENINKLLAGSGVVLDYEKDVIPTSQSASGGSVTERHILYALAFRVTAAVGKGQPVLDFLEKTLSILPAGKTRDALLNAENPDYEYSLLGVLKGSMVEQFYIPATDECPSFAEFVAFTKEIGAISAYPYLGDVGDSVTGDKKAQTFEDAFLDELVPWLAGAGLDAITFMPTRNTPAQLARLMALCDKNGLFQISGEDINSPQQSFICPQLADPAYKHLVTNTWALIGHERAASQAVENGMFSGKTLAETPELKNRIEKYVKIGKNFNL
ncbi:PHP domain-containing protein [Ruminococcaceae bacterium OttesenSCG-928-D13]|nr:PHP domain-containing protein [Ruminococcaceae bacterium OttesenSCG-928-D13]